MASSPAGSSVEEVIAPKGDAAMVGAHWMNSLTGHTLEAGELAELRIKAHAVYEANGHIFEDEADALTALGVVPVLHLAA
jgi:hypothetical protein